MTWEGRGIFEVSSADPDSATPVWVDLTVYVNDVVMTPTLRTGRQNDLDQTEPSQLQLVLNNADDRFTYGNTSSPYGAWWGPGRRCRYRDVVAGAVVPLFVGFLQTPTEGLVTASIDQRVGITAVDRLGRLQNSRTLISTLAEHIIYNAGQAIRGYWTFSQIPSADYFKLSDQAQWTDNLGAALLSVPTDTGAPSISAGGPVAADELGVVSLAAATGTTAGRAIITAAPDIRVVGPWPIAAGQAVTLVGWFSPALPADPRTAIPLTLITASNVITIDFSAGAGAPLTISSTGALVGSLSADYLTNSQWTPVAFRYDYTVPSLEVWIRSARYTVPLVGAPPASESILVFSAPTDYAGQVGHVQLYIGTDYTYAKFLAQYQMAYTVLERQTTGDRIRLIAQYAGIPDAELLQVDKGQSLMQAASLAGQTPLDAMQDAARTEQGLLYVDGNGNLVFRDRRSLYNI
ncbi:MAG: hypothetical protein V4515_12750 [Chloroflexota bacterium]